MSRLILVPTPLGNLEDITLRAIRILKECDLILAEDTRVTAHLLKHLEISKPLKSYHQHNEHKIIDELVQQIANNNSTVLVSDAGTPAISDPVAYLIKEIRENGTTVIITTHYMDEAEVLCDRVAIIDSGKIIAINTPNHLIDELVETGFEKVKELKKANLEDVFIHLTGKALREE